MNTSSDAAEQVMRMMLEGSEVLIKLSGTGAKETAILIASALRQKNKTSGQARLSAMLRSGKELKVYTFHDGDLEKFKECAKEYGVLFCVLKDKNKTDTVFDVLVRAEDASKLTRIMQRFKITQVNGASIKADIIREAEQKAKAGQGAESAETPTEASEEPTATEQEGETQAPPEPTQSKGDRITEELCGSAQGEPEANPMIARTEPNPEAAAEPARPTSREGVPSPTPEPMREDTQSQIQTEESLTAETTSTETVKPAESSPSATISASDRKASDRDAEREPEKKESVRAALERIRRRREEARRSGELPKIKIQEPKGKER